MRIAVSVHGKVEAHGDVANEAIEGFLDETVDELDRLGAEDLVVDLDLSTRTVRLKTEVEAANPLAAIEEASALFRTAIHKAGGATPDWPGIDEEHTWGVRLVGVNAEEESQLVDA